MSSLSRYTPYSLGLDTVLNRLDALSASGTSFPPYNISSVGEYDDAVITLEVALAGIAKDRIEVATERGVLTISCKAPEVDESRVYLHKGLANRGFCRNFQLADDAVVDSVEYVDGLLTVTVRREVPEAQKRKLLPIK